MINRQCLLLLLLTFSLVSPAFSQFKGSHKISSKLLTSLDNRNQENITIHIMLNDQVPLDQWEQYFESNKTPYDERAKILIKELKKKALETQPTLVNFLENYASFDIATVKMHWIANAITIKADVQLIKKLAEREDVQWIGENVLLQQTSYETVEMVVLPPDGVEKGLAAINAPAMWELGYTGYGTKAFIADTGVDPTHPAIAHQYHGNYFPRLQSWYPNPFRPNQNANGPFDCSNHGTHVTGTILGIDRLQNDTIGVAYNATWIGGAILCGVGTDDNVDAFEWALDPDGDDDTTEDIPDVINNSWYDPSLDELDCYSIYVPILHTLELVGVAVIFSAGNEGPDPGTITQPHNINISEVNSFTVGALNGNSASLPIADFSSKGPSHCEGEGSIKIKPEVSAPGVSVRSCVPGNDYAWLSGTSMAAPHVSGSILLLKEAFPYLGGKELKTALYHTCTDLGSEGEDNVYGMGIINVYAAFQYLLNEGHIPVNPRKSRDAILLDVRHAVMGCNGNVQPFILVENAGADTIFSLDIEYGVDTFKHVYVWEGVLLSNQRTYLQLPDFKPGLGFVTLFVDVNKINEQEDEKPGNNKKSLAISVTERESLVVEFELENNLCSGADFVLTSPLGAIGDHETSWYDAPFQGEKLYEGNLILLNADTVQPQIFAELNTKAKIGIPASDISKSYFENIKNSGLVFDALADFTLRSFDIVSQTKHNAEFVVLNEQGDIIHSTTRPSLPEGEKTISVNWFIPQGENYKLLKKVGKGLLTQNQDVNYPYELENIVRFKSGVIEDSIIGDEYKGFYNLQFSYIEPCGRIPYIFSVREDTVQFKADFAVSADTLRLPNFNFLEGWTLLPEGTFVEWQMGDGTVYNVQNIMHSYQNPGTYTICFHVVDQNQCFTAGIKDIVVLLSSSSQDPKEVKPDSEVWVYPNPTSTLVILEKANKGFCSDCPVYFFDQRGVQKYMTHWNDAGKLEVPVDMWSSGVYFIQMYSPTGVNTYRFVKI